jgi:hypothetical protein
MSCQKTNHCRRQALTLQESLKNICLRVETVKNEHEKLEGENKFLQKYVTSPSLDRETLLTWILVTLEN